MKTWVKDYGAFVAAAAAVVATIVNGYLQHRRERRFKTGEWLRQIRMPRYAAFIRAADVYEDAIFFEYGIHDPDFHGPMPKEIPDLAAANKEFRHQLAEVQLVGPPEVAVAAKYVQYSLWEYSHRLQDNPDNWGQNLALRVMDEFIAAARTALDVEGGPSAPLSFFDWKKAQTDDD